MKIEIKVPSVGESINSADIESWEKSSGERVKKGDILVILETDKASMEIPAKQEGVLNIVKDKGVVSVGDVIGFLETDSDKSSSSPQENISSDKKPSKENSSSFSLSKASAPLLDEVSSPPPEAVVSSFQNTRKNLSPAVRRLVESHGLDPTTLKGTGKAGRLIKEDLLKALESPSPPPLSSPSTGNEISQSISTSQKTTPSLRKGQKREKMTGLRRKTAEKLVYSQHSTATLSTFNEVDLSRIIEIRKKYQEEFLKKHGYKLGFMSFFVQAVVSALKTYPRINAFIEGEDIIYNDHQHIGIAVSTEKGLVVPVLFHAEDLSLAKIEKKILEYKDKALSRKLSPDDLIGGTFTISNGGVFGSLLSTPILNPPQSGILGMHKIEQRPVAIEGRVEIRPMMYVTLSYDHRIVDGRESVGFLVKVKEILEEPSRLLIHF